MHKYKRGNWKMDEKNKGKEIEENERNVSVQRRPTMLGWCGYMGVGRGGNLTPIHP
jgi:hypothetical protein